MRPANTFSNIQLSNSRESFRLWESGDIFSDFFLASSSFVYCTLCLFEAYFYVRNEKPVKTIDFFFGIVYNNCRNHKTKENIMGLEFITKLPTPQEIRSQYPIDAQIRELKKKRDQEIRDVFTGNSSKFIVIIGPCSADNEDAVCDYLLRLRKVQEKISDKVLIIPRVYTNKPRTTGEGYKGMVHQPDPEKKPDMLAGLIAIRKMHIRAIRESGFTCADEMLYPENWRYLSDLLSYVAVGARSVEDQQHRLTVSGMDVPAGMKNPTSGDYSVMLNSIVAAQSSHRFIYRSWEVESSGNELAHCILRGAVNKHGEAIPNYHYEDLRLLL